MFTNTQLQDHLETSSSIGVSSTIIAEWNMNVANNISKIGNYRFRPTAEAASEDGVYRLLQTSYDPNDGGPADNAVRFYTGATDADVVIDGGIDKTEAPLAFTSIKEKEKLLYSLEDCLNRFRPRSGINKARFFDGKYVHHDNVDMTSRPRYYMPHKEDNFKYWSSFRTENNVERGISKNFNGRYYIDDAAPFVVYENEIPVNRIIVKMQTNVGSVNLGPYTNSYTTFADPLYGDNNKTTPVRWKIQYLDGDSWVDAISFDELSARADGSAIVKSDGYVEVSYGLVVPEKYSNSFKIAGEYSSANALPFSANIGDAYLVKETATDIGDFFVWDGDGYESFQPVYNWHISDDVVTNKSNFATDLVLPETFIDPIDSKSKYREIQYISGVRVVAETMNVDDCTFDLIEMSPRLAVDLSDKVTDISITKSASDLGTSGMPVGQILASTGKINLFDYDNAFSDTNLDSIISDAFSQNIQIKIYENILNVGDQDFSIPVKTMYTEGFPELNKQDRSVSMTIRDLFFYFESISAPQILIQNASVSYAVSMLLDSAGFSNYTFRRNPDESEATIPYFFVAPDKSLAEALQDIAVSTQTAMFFDEYNNFIMMSKNYMLPSVSDRETDMTLIGSTDFFDDGILENKATNTKLANIISLNSTSNSVYNDGSIRFTNRYIQRSYNSIKQASRIDRDKSWIYKPVLLWEVSGSEVTKSKNEETASQSTYTLSAIPLNSTLTNVVPEVVAGTLVNNTMDFGDGVYWIGRYNGYFYSNGEVIKYDAVEYNVPGTGNVWINSVQEYQSYFSKIPFNGKLYPTGLVRIYAEPNYEVRDGVTTLKNGAVAKHGRGQFGTAVTTHTAGLDPYWSNTDRDTAPVRGIDMESKYLFSGDTEFVLSGVYSEYADKGDTVLSDKKLPVVITTVSGSQVLMTATAHGLNDGDQLTVSTTGIMHTGIVEDTIYYVTNKTANTFQIQSKPGSGPVEITALGSGNYYVLPLKDWKAVAVTIAHGDPTVITLNSHGLVEGDRLFFTTTGALPAGMTARQLYYVYYVIDANTFEISAYPDGTTLETTAAGAEIHTMHAVDVEGTMSVINDHRFAAGNKVQFVGGAEGMTYNETQPLPQPLVASQDYYIIAQGLTGKEFMISQTLNGTPVRFRQTHQLIQFMTNLNADQSVLNSKIIVPDVSKIHEDFTVEFVSGVGRILEGTKVTAIDATNNVITISPAAQKQLLRDYIDPATEVPVINQIRILDKVDTGIGAAGVNTTLAQKATRNGIVKNFLSTANLRETDVNQFQSTQTGTIQSSAFVFNGPTFEATQTPLDFISYAYKELDNSYTHFGTRMRIIGQINATENSQTPIGSTAYYTVNSALSPDQDISISGGSGGLGIMINPETNSGYYLEIITLTENNLKQYSGNSEIHNIIFYKVKKNASDPTATASSKAIPVKLWGGTSQFVVDDGLFTGQYRMAAEQNPTVYDIAVEYADSGKDRTFHIYLNDKIIATVVDTDPLPKYNNMAMFVRGSARCMFENVYAITNNYAENTKAQLDVSKSPVFGSDNDTVTTSLRKYAMSGIVQSKYLNGISPAQPPKYQMYFEEFGTIMREAAYMNIKYDKAYPALYSKISPTFNNLKGYTVSGYIGSSYGAEFMIFNNTDTALSLDETTGNYLRIQGITFTQQSQQELTVDDYFSKVSDFSEINQSDVDVVSSINRVKKDYQDIKNSRMSYGKKQFALDAPYIQDQDTAENLMAWMISKIMKPRKSIGMSVFGVPTLQLGDIVEIDYNDKSGNNEISLNDSRFVVYHIEYKKDASGPSHTVYVSEVV